MGVTRAPFMALTATASPEIQKVISQFLRLIDSLIVYVPSIRLISIIGMFVGFHERYSCVVERVEDV